MIIDFHTHVFPDKIADATIRHMSEKAGAPYFSDGTEAGLTASLISAGADIAVNLPVLTKPSQFDSVTKFAMSINERFAAGGKILSFGGIHPSDEDAERHLEYLKEQGFKGIKIHPDYQGEYIDSDNYFRILRRARELGLITVTHAGFDQGFPELTRCTPDRILRMLDRLGGYSRFVLAHMGSYRYFEEVYSSIAGLDLYIDTSLVLDKIDPSLAAKIIRRHGTDRILFATDSPWADIGKSAEILHSLGFSPEEEEKIFSTNALNLLGLTQP